MSYLQRLRSGEFSGKTSTGGTDNTAKSPLVGSVSGKESQFSRIPDGLQAANDLPLRVYRFRVDGCLVTTHHDAGNPAEFLQAMVERFGADRSIRVIESWPICH